MIADLEELVTRAATEISCTIRGIGEPTVKLEKLPEIIARIGLLAVAVLFALSLFCGCASAQTVCGAARDSVIGMWATVPVEVAKHLSKHPQDRSYFMSEADTIEGFGLMWARQPHRGLPSPTKPLRKEIHLLPPPCKEAEAILITASRFMLGGSETAVDPPYLCAGLANAIRDGMRGTVKEVRARCHTSRMEYAMMRANETGCPGQYSDQLHFSGGPPTIRIAPK